MNRKEIIKRAIFMHSFTVTNFRLYISYYKLCFRALLTNTYVSMCLWFSFVMFGQGDVSYGWRSERKRRTGRYRRMRYVAAH